MTYGDHGIGVSVLCPAAVRTAIIAGKEDTPEGRDAITTDEVADGVIDGLAEGRFMISTHPWCSRSSQSRLATTTSTSRRCAVIVRVRSGSKLVVVPVWHTLL